MRRPVPASTSVRPARNIRRRSVPVFGRPLDGVAEVPDVDVEVELLEPDEPLPLRPGFCERPPSSLWEPEFDEPLLPLLLLLPPPDELELLPLPANGSVYWLSPAPPAPCAIAPAGSASEAVVRASARRRARGIDR